jgi:hypothetical protein
MPEAEPADDLVAAFARAVPEREVPAAGALERSLGISGRFENGSGVNELSVGELRTRV